ncbi:MAG: hypothetical protein ACXWCV_14090 [Caldimonas sp.]
MTGAVVALILALAPIVAAGASLDFDATFVHAPAPPRQHYVAVYRLGEAEHRLEVWRDAESRLKRRTDAGIETFVSRVDGHGEWSMVVLDLRRRIRTDIRRTNLMRIGHFTDWFALSRSLGRPAGPYRLESLPRREVPRLSTVAPCRWYRLNEGGRDSRICWNAGQQLALAIVDAQDRVQWQVVEVDARALPAGTFAIDDRGFVRNDANADIQAD